MPTATSCARWRCVVRDANERMERLIASLLALASSEAGIVQARGADLAEIVAPALDREGAFAQGGALQLDATLVPAPVVGDPVLLERLVENLIENAVRYNAAVGLGARAHRDRARLGAPARDQSRRAHRPVGSSRSCSSCSSAAWSPRVRARPAATGSAWPSSAPSRRPMAAASRSSPAARAASR